jgi:predicted nucleic acid-binding protein
MKIILCDTNVVYGLFRQYHNAKVAEMSILVKMSQKHTVYISSYIISELQETLQKKENISLSVEDIVSISYAL